MEIEKKKKVTIEFIISLATTIVLFSYTYGANIQRISYIEQRLNKLEDMVQVVYQMKGTLDKLIQQ